MIMTRPPVLDAKIYKNKEVGKGGIILCGKILAVARNDYD